MTSPRESVVLEVNLPAIVRNWRLLSKNFTGPECAAVVKADAYGLGAVPVTRALKTAGCKSFFVATLEEGVALKTASGDARLFVFHGPAKGEEAEFATHGVIPVLNNLEQLQRWKAHGNGAPSALHVDTGMTRLGISLAEAEALDKSLLAACNVAMVMSHLACAGEPAHKMNKHQLAGALQMKALFPGLPISLVNSSGIFLPPEFHFDLARPGCSLYGITPNESLPTPVENVVQLTAPILQVRKVDKPTPVGYEATHMAPVGASIATVALGYADGFMRSLSNRSTVFIGDAAAPVIGRVSMDMITVDVSHLPAGSVTPGHRVTLIGKQQPVDTLAECAGTIGYEIFTRLGSRVRREYKS